MLVLNLTQHPATPEQKAQGVEDLEGADLESLRHALTMTEPPDLETIEVRAEWVAALAASEPWPDAAMIGGAPWLMSSLEKALRKRGIRPVYAFSKRESIEETTRDGCVVKKSVFRHVKLIDVPA